MTWPHAFLEKTRSRPGVLPALLGGPSHTPGHLRSHSGLQRRPGSNQGWDLTSACCEVVLVLGFLGQDWAGQAAQGPIPSGAGAGVQEEGRRQGSARGEQVGGGGMGSDPGLCAAPGGEVLPGALQGAPQGSGQDEKGADLSANLGGGAGGGQGVRMKDMGPEPTSGTTAPRAQGLSLATGNGLSPGGDRAPCHIPSPQRAPADQGRHLDPHDP